MQPDLGEARRDHRAHRHRPRRHRGRRPRSFGRATTGATARASSPCTGNASTTKASRRSCSPVGGSYIQLLGALGPDTPVGRFLATRRSRRPPRRLPRGRHRGALDAPPAEGSSADRRSPARGLAEHADRVRASPNRWAASWWSWSRRADAAGAPSRVGATALEAWCGALINTATLPSGRPPSPISWCTCPLCVVRIRLAERRRILPSITIWLNAAACSSLNRCEPW